MKRFSHAKRISLFMVFAMIISMAIVASPLKAQAMQSYEIKTQADFDNLKNATFSPGDIIYFERGMTFKGDFTPQGSGSAGAPIQVLAEGTGSLPVIDGTGYQECFLLKDQQYWEISDLQLVHGNLFNLRVEGTSHTVSLNHFRVTDCALSNCDADAAVLNSYDCAGLSFMGNFNDVVIDGCTVHDTHALDGIVINSDHSDISNNNVIQNCTVYNVYGDGILMIGQNNGLIQNCVAHNCGNAPSNNYTGLYTSVAIWQVCSSNSTVRNCEAYNQNCYGVDGGAFDLDYIDQNCSVEYCYGHDCKGSGVLFCATANGTNSVTSNVVARYNILVNNGNTYNNTESEFQLNLWNGGSFNGVQIYNNTSYWNPANGDLPVLEVLNSNNDGSSGFSGSNANFFKNNIVYSTEPYMINCSTNLVLDNNLYDYSGGSENAVWTYGGTSYYGWTSYHVTNGNEPHSLFADPLFAGNFADPIGLVDPSSYTRNVTALGMFELQNSSPALGTGALIPDNGGTDLFGNVVSASGACNIGAYNGTGVSAMNTDWSSDLMAMDNPDFEIGGLSHWLIYNNAATLSSPGANNSSYCAIISPNGGIGQTVTNLNPNTTYVFTAYCKVSDGTPGAVLFAQNYGGNPTYSSTISCGDFTQYSVTFTTGTINTTADVGLWSNDGYAGTIACDNFSLCAVNPSNLLTNSGFESGDFSGWSNTNGVILNSGTNSGTYCASISSNAGIGQTITNLQPNTTYVLQAHCKVTDGNPGAVLYAQNFGGNAVYSNGIYGNDYSLYSVVFTTGSSATTADVGLWSNAGYAGTIVCDDFTLYAASGIISNVGNNLLTNAGFESGNCNDWITLNTDILNYGSHSGNFCASVGANGGVWQAFSDLQPNTTYILQAYCKVTSGTPTVDLYAKNYGGGDIYSFISCSGTYALYTMSFSTFPNCTTAEVGLWSNGPGTVVCDDLKLYAVPN